MGYRLSTYAMWWIKANIQEFILKSTSIVKIGNSSTQKKIYFAIQKLKSKIITADKQAISHDDLVKLSNDINTPVKEVQNMAMMMANGGDVSLNTNIANNENKTVELIDTIDAQDNHELNILHHNDFQYKRELLYNALENVKPRDKDIFISRYLHNITLKELSHKYDVSIERIRQISDNTFKKIQQTINITSAI